MTDKHFPPIQTTRRFSLHLANRSPEKGRPFLSAASGVVFHHDRFYVVADDEHALFQFELDGTHSRTIVFPGEALPTDPVKRKKRKGDLESVQLIQGTEYSVSGILAWPSFSTDRRTTVYLVPFLEGGELQEAPLALDFSTWRQVLKKQVSEPNIEGVVLLDDRLLLLQRGNGREGQNGIFVFTKDDFKNVLNGDSCEPSPTYTPITLGEIDGVPLGFTDGVPVSSELFLGLASAEDSENVYKDGAITGSALFAIRKQGNSFLVIPLGKFSDRRKFEGIAWSPNPDEKKVNEEPLHLWLVDDSDHPSQKSGLFAASLRQGIDVLQLSIRG